MNRSNLVVKITFGLIVGAVGGCGPGAANESGGPNPSKQKAIDVTNPAFEKVEGKGAKP